MAERNPLVSIVVCTYNGEKFLHQQLESLVSQTYALLEIIISDDGSSDDTLRIAREFAAMDRRIRIYENPVNLGYNKNFEHAFFHATGEFIAVSDQDDIWKNNKIEKMLRLFTRDDILLAHCQSVRFSGEVPQMENYSLRQPFEGSDVRKLMFFNTIAGHNIMFRKKLIYAHGIFPEGVFYDWWLAIIAATYGEVAATDSVLTFHRFHESNLTLGKKDEGRQTRQKAAERLHTIGAILQLEGLKPDQKEFAKGLQAALETIQEKQFSPALFKFLSRNARIIFFFKKKSLLSKLKMAYRMSFALS